MKIVNSTALISNNLPSAELLRPEKSDQSSQTTLSFPPKLPKELEDLLKKYEFIEEETDCANGSMMDISTLRRKLFIQAPESPEEFNEESFCGDLSPPPRTPELTKDKNTTSSQECANDSFGSDMFGELSPIRKCSSPQVSADVSMVSDFGHETPSRGFYRKKKGKNLSESFLSLQHEFDEKENNQTIVKEAKRFARFDSGFPNDEDSKLSSTTELATDGMENMQFWKIFFDICKQYREILNKKFWSSFIFKKLFAIFFKNTVKRRFFSTEFWSSQVFWNY